MSFLVGRMLPPNNLSDELKQRWVTQAVEKEQLTILFQKRWNFILRPSYTDSSKFTASGLAFYEGEMRFKSLRYEKDSALITQPDFFFEINKHFLSFECYSAHKGMQHLIDHMDEKKCYDFTISPIVNDEGVMVYCIDDQSYSIDIYGQVVSDDKSELYASVQTFFSAMVNGKKTLNALKDSQYWCAEYSPRRSTPEQLTDLLSEKKVPFIFRPSTSYTSQFVFTASGFETFDDNKDLTHLRIKIVGENFEIKTKGETSHYDLDSLYKVLNKIYK